MIDISCNTIKNPTTAGHRKTLSHLQPILIKSSELRSSLFDSNKIKLRSALPTDQFDSSQSFQEYKIEKVTAMFQFLT